MFKDILYPTFRSVQNQTIDRRIIYITGTLVSKSDEAGRFLFLFFSFSTNNAVLFWTPFRLTLSMLKHQPRRPTNCYLQEEAILLECLSTILDYYSVDVLSKVQLVDKVWMLQFQTQVL